MLWWVGLGNTLVSGIRYEIKNGPDDKLTSMFSSEKVVNQFMDSIKDGKSESLYQFYMQRCVITYDISVLAGKDRNSRDVFQYSIHLHQSRANI